VFLFLIVINSYLSEVVCSLHYQRGKSGPWECESKVTTTYIFAFDSHSQGPLFPRW